MSTETKTERKSPRELNVSRKISGPVERVFRAWTDVEIFKKWWVPKSAPIKLESCEMDVRLGGTYRLVFSAGDQTAEFFGKYLDVVPNTRIQWTNDEGGPESANVTTVNFAQEDDATLVTVHDLYPSKEALDEAIATGSSGALPEQLQQLEDLVGNSK